MIHYFNEPSIEAGAIPLGVPLFTLCKESLIFDPFSKKWNIDYTNDVFKVSCPKCKKMIDKVVEEMIK